MSEWNMLVWLTQLGLSVAVPIAGFAWLAVWLRGRYALGVWVVFLGLLIGFACAAYSFRVSLKEMERMEKNRLKRKPQSAPRDQHQ